MLTKLPPDQLELPEGLKTDYIVPGRSAVLALFRHLVGS